MLAVLGRQAEVGSGSMQILSLMCQPFSQSGYYAPGDTPTVSAATGARGSQTRSARSAPPNATAPRACPGAAATQYTARPPLRVSVLAPVSTSHCRTWHACASPWLGTRPRLTPKCRVAHTCGTIGSLLCQRVSALVRPFRTKAHNSFPDRESASRAGAWHSALVDSHGNKSSAHPAFAEEVLDLARVYISG